MDMVATDGQVFREGRVFAIVTVVECPCGEHFQSARAIFHGEVIVVRPPVIIVHPAVCLHTQAVALLPDGELAVAAFHAGQHREQVVGGAYVVQDGVFHIHRNAARRGFVLGYLALYGHVFQTDGIGQQRDGADIAHRVLLIDSLVAHERHADKHTARSAGDDEVASLIAHAAIDECGIAERE